MARKNALKSLILLERETGFEPATLALARRCSTAELFPQKGETNDDRRRNPEKNGSNV